MIIFFKKNINLLILFKRVSLGKQLTSESDLARLGRAAVSRYARIGGNINPTNPRPSLQGTAPCDCDLKFEVWVKIMIIKTE